MKGFDYADKKMLPFGPAVADGAFYREWHLGQRLGLADSST